MKMKLYYVVEDSGFDDMVDCIMQAGPYGTFQQAYANCKDHQFVVEQIVQVE